MATLTVLEFPTAEGAQTMLSTLENLQKQQLIQIEDGAIITWPAGARKPKTEQLRSMTGAGALGGAFWGMLFGLLFFVPFFGLAVGAAVGAVAGSMRDYGIDDTFIKEVGNAIQPGTSALFVLVQQVTVDKVVEQLRPFGGKIVRTSLSAENEAKLKDAFGQE